MLGKVLARVCTFLPACGTGKMAAALRQAGFDVVASDIAQGVDFLDDPPQLGVSAIITNPPYALA
jgi:hypothetical protein